MSRTGWCLAVDLRAPTETRTQNPIIARVRYRACPPSRQAAIHPTTTSAALSSSSYRERAVFDGP